MRERKGIAVLLGLLACGLIAAGCGSDNSDTSTAATSAETSTTEASTTESSTTASSEGATPDDVYNACIDAIAGTPAESVGKSGCQQARDAFETCATQADNAPEGTARDAAIAACQQAADATTAALQAGG